MSVSLGDMHAHLMKIIAAAQLAQAAKEASERALSDVVAQTHWQDFDIHIHDLIALVCADAGGAIVAALADEVAALIADLGHDDPRVAPVTA